MKKRRRFAVVVLITTLFVVALIALVRRDPGLYKVAVLPSLGGQFMSAGAMNDRGQIVGLSGTKGGTYHLFLWDSNDGMRNFGPIEGLRLDINNAGQVSGTMRDVNG